MSTTYTLPSLTAPFVVPPTKANFAMDYKYATSDLNRRHELKVMHMAFPGITNVRIATKEQDISGYDYALTHPRIPQELFIDVKRARAGRKRYWKNDIPDVTIELVNNGLKGTMMTTQNGMPSWKRKHSVKP